MREGGKEGEGEGEVKEGGQHLPATKFGAVYRGALSYVHGRWNEEYLHTCTHIKMRRR